MADLMKSMEAEKTRLDKEQDEVQKQIEDLHEKLEGIQKQREAIGAYFDALKGKKKPTQPKGERRTGVREAVLQIIRSSPTGIKAGDVVKALNSDGDKKYTTAIYQALAALKRDKKVTADDGQYKVV